MRNKDSDPIETNEWLEAINSVIEEEGVDRASYLLTKIAERLNQEGAIPSYNCLLYTSPSPRDFG